MSNFNLLVILGPTASGKTQLAVQLARHLGGEILSADSRQVYRGLDIGSGKDLEEYKDVPYHLIDIVDPGYEFNIFDFQNAFFCAFEDIVERHKLPVMAGGSALYVDSILNGYRLVPVPRNEDLRETLSHCSHEELTEYLLSIKPNQHNTTDLLERSRLVRAIEIAEGEQSNSSTLPQLPPLDPLVIGIKWERSITRSRITKRLKFRLEYGLIEEVRDLHHHGISWQTLEYYGLEYRLVAQYLQNQITHEQMFEKLNIAIHQFAKKQDTWLRRLQRNGVLIHWVDGTENCFEQSLKLIEQMK